jgi:CHAT domain-containing protein
VEEAAQRYAEAFAPSLDRWTLVLRYELGDKQSVLWTAAASGPPGRFLLAPRAEIEAVTRRLHEAVQAAGTEAEQVVREAAADLSHMLLAPAAREIATRPRLVVIADDGLARVPFAMLPVALPGGDGVGEAATQPLVAARELVVLPADMAEAVVDVRREPKMGLIQRGPVVVGDPVLRADDPRLAAVLRSGAADKTAAAPVAILPEELVRGLSRLGLGELPRLPHARAEMEAVVPEDRSRDRYAGLEATVDLLQDEIPRRFRLLHISALAVLTAEASGLVLSCFDEDGQPVNGFLRLGDLAELDLPVQLLTVTGVRCAWQDGASGLALVRAARLAGAKRTVTSLWSTDDESTVELMRRYYAELIGGRARPPVALRRAQVAVAAMQRFSAPRHWAGFFFSGDWSMTRAQDAAGDGGSIEASDKGGTGDAGMLPTDIPAPPPCDEELPPRDLPPVAAIGKS